MAGEAEPSIFTLYGLVDLLHNNRTVLEFWEGWREETNPWSESFAENDGLVYKRFVVFTLLFLSCNAFFFYLAKHGFLSGPLTSRPTVVANQLHCTLTTLAAASAVLNFEPESVEKYDFTRNWLIPFTSGYFACDFLWYCIPQGDYLIAIHHAVMFSCYLPLGSHTGAAMFAAGDEVRAIRIAARDLLCEVSNPFMNWRWYLMQTLDKHRFDYAVVNVVLLFTMVGLCDILFKIGRRNVARVFLVGYTIAFDLLPNVALYVEERQVMTFSVVFLAHVVICLMSVKWAWRLVAGGFMRMLVFTKKAPKDKEVFPWESKESKAVLAAKQKLSKKQK